MEVKIEVEEWDHTCGDGCCYEWGVTVKINDEEVNSYTFSPEPETLIKDVLEHLGYKTR